MSWAVKVSKGDSGDGRQFVTLYYGDGTRTVTETIDIASVGSVEALAARAQSKIDALTAQDALFKSIPEGELISKDLIPPGLTPAQQYEVAFREWLKLRKLIDLGVTDTTLAEFVALDKTVKTTFLPDYVSGLNL